MLASVKTLLPAALALAALLPAQRRQPLVGTVVDADGKPLVAATVTLVEDDPDLVGLDPVDVLSATTDERGRFLASALQGVRYTAFATGPEQDGRALVARPVSDLCCGRRAELRVAHEGVRRRVQLTDLSQWGDPADLRARLSQDHCPGYELDLAIDAEGRVELPPTIVIGSLSLHDRTGGRLGSIGIATAIDQPVLMPQCTELRVRVVDSDGQPIAGALVAVQHHERIGGFFGMTGEALLRGDAAITDADGRASVRCGLWTDPFTDAPESLVVLASKPGFAEGASGWVCKQPFVGWNSVAEHKRHELRIPLLAVDAPAGPAVGEAEAGARSDPAPGSAVVAGTRARLFAMGIVLHRQDGVLMHYYLPRSYDVTVDAGGELVVPQLPREAQDLTLQLPPVDGRRVILRPSRAPLLPSADLATCELLSLQLLDVTGGPASSASLLLVPRQARELDFKHAAPLVPDQAGRLEVLLQSGDWTLMAMDAASWATVELNDWSASQPLTLQLAAKPSRRVRVVDVNGAPVSGAKFEPGSFRQGWPAAPGVDTVLVQLGWNTLGEHVRRATTDARGEATLQFLPWPNTQPTVFAWLGDHRTHSEDAPIAEGDDVLVLQLK